jgi:hypothetical protein
MKQKVGVVIYKGYTRMNDDEGMNRIGWMVIRVEAKD